jgi:glutamyl-tRNA synthetase
MHLGNLFCALMAWLSVRSAGGRILLRIEDLDLRRCPEEGPNTGLLLEDLRWLGLDFDEGEGVGGPHAPYRQSQRFSLYEQALEKLQRAGHVYPCFCSRAELHAAEAPHLSDGRVLYAGTCRGLSAQEIERKSRVRPPALRLQVPKERISFCDRLRGEYAENLAEECGDFIIRRSDGVYAYQLAVVVDDAAMGVSEVVRGQDLLSSTPRQLLLYRMLGQPAPQFFHLPLLLAPDGRRLSKRDRDLDMGELRRRYAGPEPILGKLAALCGLLPKAEPVKAQELIGCFCWGKLKKEDILVPPGMF